MRGMPRAKEIDFANVRPTSKDPTSPGPTVAAIADRPAYEVPDCSRASRTTGTMARRCSREASSGTTPPYRACVASCEATTEDRIDVPSSTTAAAVSSHEDSIPRTRTLSILRDDAGEVHEAHGAVAWTGSDILLSFPVLSTDETAYRYILPGAIFRSLNPGVCSTSGCLSRTPDPSARYTR